MIGTVTELRKRISAEGSIHAGPELDEGLLTDLLETATSRLQEECPGRTLEALPELVVDGEDLVDTGEPIERRFPARRIIQVPDLREVVSITLHRDGGLGDDVAGQAVERYSLIHPSDRPDWPAIYLKLPRWDVYGRDDELRIVGRWGPAESSNLLPKRSVRGAALLWAARAYHARAARYSDTSSSEAGGVVSYFRQLPADVQATVNALLVPGS